MSKRGVLVILVLFLSLVSIVQAGISNVDTCSELKTAIENNNNTNITSNINCAGVDFGDWRSGNVNTFTENITGNNFTIFNLTLTGTSGSYSSQYVGLIPKANKADIKDIILHNLTIKTGTSPAGLVGEALNVNITNVYINASINDTGGTQDYAGGIVAYAENSTLYNVIFNGTLITVDDKKGGIIGATSPNGIGTIINNSEVFGKIQGEINIGGFVGYSENLKLVNSKGNVTVVGETRDIGGAIGNAYSKTDILNVNLTVSILSLDSTVDNLGGLVGRNGDGSYFFVNNSHVKGSVIGSDDYIGGFIGYAYDNATISDSSFIGTVEGDQHTGGIAGYSYGASNKYNYFLRTFSKGKVKGLNSHVGGLIGNIAYYTEVNDSGSLMTVESTKSTGNLFIGGFAGDHGTSSNLYRNYFAGKIINKTNAYVGGFVGDIGSGTLADNFYDNDTSQIQGPSGGSSKPTDSANILGQFTWQLKQNDTFSTWNLTNVWRAENSYPIPYWFWEDLDDDGVEDIKDSLIGNETSITAVNFNPTLIIAGSAVLNNSYSGLNTVNLTDGDNNTLSFEHNFSSGPLEIKRTGEQAFVEKALNGMVLKELRLQNPINKTVKTAITNNTAICVKDSRVEVLSNVSTDCSSTNEAKFEISDCMTGNSKTINGRSVACTFDDAYIVSGLEHSAIAAMNSNLSVSSRYMGDEGFNQVINFVANYSDLNTGNGTENANCNITFDNNGTTYDMSWNSTSSIYNKTMSFSSSASHTYLVSCFEPSHQLLTESSTHTITIGNCTEMQDAIKANDNLTLRNNIDCTGISFTNWYNDIYDGSVTMYNRSFNGMGFQISNILIDENQAYVGLITKSQHTSRFYNVTLHNVTVRGTTRVGGVYGSIENFAFIEDVNITGLNVTSYTTSGNIYLGGVIGDTGNSGSDGANLTNVHVSGNISANKVSSTSQAKVGGLVGEMYYLKKIINSSFTGTVNSTGDYVGGIVGYKYMYADVWNTYSKGTIKGNDYVGGLAGYIDYPRGIWNNTYSWMNVTGNDYVGGLFGMQFRSSYTFDLHNSYYAGNLSNETANAGGIGGGFSSVAEVSGVFYDSTINPNINSTGNGENAGSSANTTAILQTQSTFTNQGWDFTNIWHMNDGSSYPHLLYEILPPIPDTTSPTFTEYPANLTIGPSEAFAINVNATDASGIDSWDVNDSNNFEINNSGYLINKTNLSIGTLFINVSVTDNQNNVNYFIYKLTISDVTAPTWDVIPANQTIVWGEESLTADFDASDDNSISSYYINNTLNFKINSTTGILENKSPHLGTSHHILVSVNDSSNNINSTIFTVTTNKRPQFANEFNLTAINNNLFNYNSSCYDLGDFDIVANYRAAQRVVWHENNGTDNFTLNSLDSNFGSQTVKGVDIDKDGDVDVIAAGSGGLKIYKNNGSETFSSGYTKTGLGSIYHLDVGDINKDGFLDIVTTSFTDNEITVFQNQNNGSYNISTLDTFIQYPTTIELVDLDEDGDLDITGVGLLSHNLFWYSNNGSGNFTFSNISTYNSIQGHHVTDLDLDGDLDIIAANSTSLKWFKNNGSENFTTITINETGSGKFLNSIDFDFDGDIDIIAPLTTKGIGWYENDGSENFVMHNTSFVFNSITGVNVEDIDEDGDYDIIISDTNGEKLYLLKNNGSQNFTRLTVYDDLFGGWEGLFPEQNDVIDVDRDGSSLNYYDNSSLFNISQNGVVSFTPTGAGTHAINFSCDDGSLNTSQIIFLTINPDTPPTWDTIPNNASIEYASESLLVDFDASDDANNLDQYFINNTIDFTINSTGHLINNSLLSIATHSVNVSVNDSNNNINSTIFTVTVSDSTSPTWDTIPANASIEYSSENLLADFEASDADFENYYVNNTDDFSINSTGHLINNTLLTITTYSVNVIANDSSNNAINTIFTVTVSDTTAPTFTEYPANTTIEYAVDSITINVNATDASSIDTWYLDDNVNFTINQSGYLQNNTLLTVGNRIVNVFVNDTYGYTNSFTFVAIVSDSTSPTWTTIPNNASIEYSSESLLADFEASDSDLDQYFTNNSADFSINSTGHLINNSLLGITTHILIVSANDTSNNSISTVFTVTVSDSTSPTWDTIPANASIEYNSESLLADFEASDADFEDYYVNNTDDFSINSTGHLINNSLLGITTHILIVSANDSSNNVINTIFTVTVSDTTAPTFNETPANVTVEYYLSSLSININATDNSLDEYFINDTTNFNITQDGVLKNASALSIDQYFINISINDTSNNYATFTLNANVTDTTPPTLNQTPTNRSHEYTNSLAIQINASDISGIGNWSINDTSNFKINNSGYFENNTVLVNDIYFVNISVNDTYDNVKSFNFNLTVTDNVAPTFNQTPSNITLEYYSASLSININASDNDLELYFVNDTTRFNISQDGILINKTLLPIGTWYANISVNDSSDNRVSLPFNVTVTDTSGPSFTHAAQGQSLGYTVDTLTVDVNATDASGLSNFSVNDTSKFTINNSGYLTNNSLLSTGTHYALVTSNDTYNNNDTLTYVVTVTDGISPTWDQYPSNLSIELGSGFTVDFNASDDVAISEYYINDTTRFNVSQEGILINFTTLPVGTWYVNVSVNDTSNNVNSTNFNVTYSDTNPPTFNESPSNDTFEYYTQAFAKQINVSDGTNVSTYYLNDTVRFKVNQSGYLENNSFMTVGTFYGLLFVNDSYNNTNQLPFRVIVNDSASPSLSQIPPNRSQEYTVALAIQINATDASGVSNWSINDTSNFKINDSGYFENNTVLQNDLYFVSISVNDTYNNLETFTFNITVTDSVVPTFDEIPTNVTVEYYSGSLSVDINATDNSLNLYTVNDTDLFNISQDGILTNKSLSVGTWYANITVNDTTNNRASLTFSATVSDTTGPSFTEIPANRTIDESVALAIDVNATDISLVSNWTINDTTNFKINDSGYLENNTALSVQTYYINISVNDTYDNVNYIILRLTGTDITSPTWDQYPSNLSIELGTAISVDFNASDQVSIDLYYINDTSRFNITQDGILKNSSYLSVETYYVNVSVNDSSNNLNHTSFSVTYSDATAPTLTQIPSNDTLEYFSDNFVKQVNATDLSNISTYYLNDTALFKVNQSGYLENNTALAIDTYYGSLFINDTYNNTKELHFQVEITDTTLPNFNQTPPNRSIEYTNSLVIQINASDLSDIGNWSINDTTNFKINDSGYFENNTALNLDVYFVNISVNDTYNNVKSITFQLTVTDSVAPTFDEIPANVSLEYYSVNLNVDINASDKSLDFYVVNDTTLFNISQDGILLNNTPLSVGTWYANVTVNDTTNNLVSLTFSVTISDTSGPTFTEIPVNRTLNQDLALAIDVNATDVSSVSNWTINDTTNFNINDSGYFENNTALTVKTYYINISVNDTYNNVQYLVFKLTITDPIAPTWNQYPSNLSIEFGTSVNVDFNASDGSLDLYFVNDTTNFNVSQDGVLSNKTALAVDTWFVNVSVNDTSNNVNSTIFSVTLTDNTIPSFTEIPSNDTLEYSIQTFLKDINATDLSNISSYYVNDTTNFDVNISGHIVNNTLLNVGTYFGLLSVNDTYNNTNQLTFQVIISDTTAPSLSQVPQNSTINQNSNLQLQINATDFSGVSNWTINDTTNFKINDSGYLENNTVLAMDDWHVNVSINDTYDNVFNFIIKFTVTDTEAPTFDEIPSNVTLEYYSTGLSVDINATDNSIDLYTVNDTRFNISQAGVLSNASTLNIGTWYVNVSVNDTSNNVVSLTFSATVSDTNIPSFTETPSNRSISVASSFALDINATDAGNVSTWYVNDTFFTINNSGYFQNSSALSIRTYYTLVSVNDSYNNTNNLYLQLSAVDQNVPTFDQSPSDRTLDYFYGALSLDVNASDPNGISTYFVNDTSNFNINGSGLLSNNSLLSIQNHYLNVSVNDTSDNVNSFVIIFTISDISGPYLTETLANRSISDSTNFALDVNATDPSNVSTFFINDTTNFVINGSGYLENISALSGSYYLNISMNDTYNNVNYTVLVLTINDITAPTFDEIPSNLSLEYVNNSFSVDVNASDASDVDIYSLNDSRFNISQEGIIINASLLHVADYVLNISVNDTSNNVNSLYFLISVNDTTPPLISSIDIVNGSIINSSSSLLSDFDIILNEYANVTLTTTNGSNIVLMNYNNSESSASLDLSPYYNSSLDNQTLNLLIYDNLSNQRIINYSFVITSGAGLFSNPVINTTQANFSGIVANTVVNIRQLPLSLSLNLTLRHTVPNSFTDLYSIQTFNSFELESNTSNSSMHSVVKFKVPKVRLDSQNIAYDNISLYSTQDGSTTSFEELNTVNISNAGDYITYDSNLSHFSTFVIGVKNAGNKTPSSSSSSSSTSSSSGGGSSSSISSYVPKLKSNEYVTKYYTISKPHTFKIESNFSVFEKVKIYPLDAAIRVRVKVVGLDSNPVSEEIKGVVYKYEDISLEKQANVRSAELSYKVPKSWIGNKDKSLISLYRYEDSWVELGSEIIKDDNEFVYYRSITPGFSYFAIVLKGELSKVEESVKEKIVIEPNVSIKEPVIEEPVEIKEEKVNIMFFLAILLIFMVGYTALRTNIFHDVIDFISYELNILLRKTSKSSKEVNKSFNEFKDTIVNARDKAFTMKDSDEVTVTRNIEFKSAEKIDHKKLKLDSHIKKVSSKISTMNHEFSNMLKYVSSMMSQGYSSNSIKKALLVKQWPSDLIERVFAYYEVDNLAYVDFKMLTRAQFNDFIISIKKNLEKGYLPDYIAKQMIKSGWPKSLIRKVFKFLS